LNLRKLFLWLLKFNLLALALALAVQVSKFSERQQPLHLGSDQQVQPKSAIKRVSMSANDSEFNARGANDAPDDVPQNSASAHDKLVQSLAVAPTALRPPPNENKAKGQLVPEHQAGERRLLSRKLYFLKSNIASRLDANKAVTWTTDCLLQLVCC
jgi:hypothetical protein